MGTSIRDLLPLAVFSIVLFAAIAAIFAIDHAFGGAPWFTPSPPHDLAGSAAGSAYDVRYARQALSWQDIGWKTSGLQAAFAQATWLSGGYFVVAGWCDPGAGLLRNGMYVLREDGTLVGTRDTCYDTDAVGLACPEGGGCQVRGVVNEVTPTSFVRDMMEQDTGANRPPALYSVSASPARVDLAAKPFRGEAPGGSAPSLAQTVVAGGELVGIQTTAPMGPCGRNVVYALPGMQLVRTWSAPSAAAGCDATPEIFPLVGVGDYLIAVAKPGVPTAHPGTSAYRVTGADVAFAQQLSEKSATGFTRDTLDPRRIALHYGDRAPGAIGETSFEAYVFGPGGATHERTITPKYPVYGALTDGAGVAMAGDYIAYGHCPFSDGSQNMQNHYAGCGVVVERAGAMLSVEPLPIGQLQPLPSNTEDLTIQGVPISDVVISPTGAMLVLPREALLHRVFLYQIEGFRENATPPNLSQYYAPAIDPITGERYLTLSAEDGASMPACAATAGQLCATTQPASSHAASGTCAAGRCYACDAGTTLQGGRCATAQGNATGQNLKVFDIVTRAGDVGAEICKSADGALNGTMDIRFSGDKTWLWTGLTVENLKRCDASALQWTAFVPSSVPFNTTTPGTQRTVTVAVTFPPQYDSVGADDTLTRQVTLQ